MKKTLRIVADVLAWIVIVLSALMTLSVFTAQNDDGIPRIGDTMLFNIQTVSMQGTINKGDSILVKAVNFNDLKKGDIISYWTTINGERAVNTHRIMQVVGKDTGDIPYFQTAGDNNKNPDGSVMYDDYLVSPFDIVGIYKARLPFLGAILDFLKTATGFFCCIILPLAVYFIYQLYNFLRVMLEGRAAKAPADAPALSAEEEEEIKRRAIEEYLAKQQQAAAPAPAEQEPEEEKKD